MGRGRKNMLVGGLIALVGGAVTLFRYQAAQGGGSYVVAWGAMAFGALQFGIGVFQQLDGPAESRADETLKLFLHAMTFVASGDGRVSEQERSAISAILERITGSALPEDVTAQQLEQIAATPPERMPEYDKAVRESPEDHRKAIVHCAFLIGCSDGEIEHDDGRRLHRVGAALGFPRDELQALIETLLKARTREAAAGGTAKPEPA